MPKIIDYSTPQRGVSYASQPSAKILTGQEGRAAEQLAKGVTDLATSITGAIHKREIQNNITDLHVGASKIDQDMTIELDKAIRDGNLDVDDFSNRINERFNELSEKMSTTEGRDAFAKHQASLTSGLMKHAVHSKAVLEGEAAVEKIKLSMRQTGNALLNNPAAFKEKLDYHKGLISSLQAKGLPSDKVAQLTRMGEEDLAKYSAQGFIQRNPYQAKKMLGDGLYDDYLDPDSKSVLMNQAQNRIDSIESKKQTIQNHKFKDPYRFMREQGIAPQPVDLNNQESVMKRLDFIEENKKKFGYIKDEIPPFTPDEARDFVRVVDSQPSDGVLRILQEADKNMPKALYRSFSKQVYGERKAFGVAMATSKYDPVTAEKIIAGNQLITNPKGKGIGALDAPARSKIQENFNSYIGNSIHDSEAREGFMDAAFSHWVKTTFDKNGSITDVDPSTFVESMKEVIGPVGKVNGSNIVSFRRESGKKEFVDINVLEDEFNSLDLEVIKKTQKDVPRLINKAPVDLERSRGRITPIPAGEGIYKLLLDQDILIDRDGKEYIIDMGEYIKEAEKRKKTGFLDSISNTLREWNNSGRF